MPILLFCRIQRCSDFQSRFPIRIVARKLVVVAHENFLRPGGEESFDVGKCLGQIDRAALALNKAIAPISPWNRADRG